MWGKLQKYFFSGLLAFMPLALTIYLFIWVINFADGLVGRHVQTILRKYLGFYIPGVGLIIGVIIIILIGFIATRYIGRKLQDIVEKILLRLPFFKQVYPALKEIAGFFFDRGKLKFEQVVLIQYPRKGIYSYGFLTNETCQKVRDLTKEELCNIFLPSAPGPATGFVFMVPKKDIIFTDITIEQAVKFNMSGGVINP